MLMDVKRASLEIHDYLNPLSALLKMRSRAEVMTKTFSHLFAMPSWSSMPVEVIGACKLQWRTYKVDESVVNLDFGL